MNNNIIVLLKHNNYLYYDLRLLELMLCFTYSDKYITEVAYS